MTFIISHLNEQMGPFSEEQLKAKWAAGELLPIDYVYDDEKKDWILVSERFAWATPIQQQSDEKRPPALPTPSRPEMAKARRPAVRLTATAPADVVQSQPAPAQSSVVRPQFEVVQTTSAAQRPFADTQVQLVDGIAELTLSSLAPGQVSLFGQVIDAAGVRVQTPHQINIQPAEPVSVRWDLARQMIVGQTLEITLKVCDIHENPCLGYSEEFIVQVAGPSAHECPVQVRDGQALVKITHTRAELWNVGLHYGGQRQLHLPESASVEWLPGEAARLEIDGAHELTAGQAMNIKVRALDAFGNVAKRLQGTVLLEFKAS